jgi:hypothetical protein
VFLLPDSAQNVMWPHDNYCVLFQYFWTHLSLSLPRVNSLLFKICHLNDISFKKFLITFQVALLSPSQIILFLPVRYKLKDLWTFLCSCQWYIDFLLYGKYLKSFDCLNGKAMEGWIQEWYIWYIVRIFISATMYPYLVQ